MSIRHAALNPARIAILDPIALKTLPASVAAHVAVDALLHAFESYISFTANPHTDSMNLYAMELMSQNIRQFVANGRNLEAGLNMACGSNLAGHYLWPDRRGQYSLHGTVYRRLLPCASWPFHCGLFSCCCRIQPAAKSQEVRQGCIGDGRTHPRTDRNRSCGKRPDAIKSMCKDLGIPIG